MVARMDVNVAAGERTKAFGVPQPAGASEAPTGPTTTVVQAAAALVQDAARAAMDRLTWSGVTATVAAGLFAYLLGPGVGSGSLAVLAAAVTASACTAVALQSSGRLRIGWGAFAAASALWSGGYRSGPMWQLASSRVATGGGGGRLCALAATALLGVGIVTLLERPRLRAAKMRFIAEALMIAASVLFAAWVSIMPPAFAAAHDLGFVDRARLLAHPLGDAALVAIVAFAVTKIPHIGRWTTSLLLGSGTLAILASATRDIAPSDTPRLRVLDLVAAACFSLIVVAALRSWRSASRTVLAPADVPSAADGETAFPDRARLLLLSAPGLSVLIVVGTTLRQVTGQPVAAELTWITIGVLALSVFLHVTVIFENHTLSADLATARDEAIRASELKSNFLANVSHEIRTPMNAVIGLTGLLLDTELESDQRELAVGVATSAEGLLGLIDEVLDFSKIEAEKMDLEETDLDLVDLVDEVAMIVGDAARKKGIQLHAYCQPGMITRRRGDPVRLRQILLNLANNAVKFTHDGSVTIEAVQVEGSPEHVAFLVVDTGIGIPETEQERLFQPFSQLDESTTRVFGGTGLGLAIVAGLVDVQDGSIDIASEEGVGTVFRVTLPLPVGTNQSTEEGLSGLFGKRALVIDDNAVNRSVLAHTLHGWGFVVDQAESGQLALDRFAWANTPQDPYSVVIIEHHMDGMDGLHLAQILRNQPPTADAVTFLLSSAVNLSRQDAHDAGLESVLVKPVRTTYLLRRIVDALITQPESKTPKPSRKVP
jgi:two-component system sensor histidine kinase/response regulator